MAALCTQVTRAFLEVLDVSVRVVAPLLCPRPRQAEELLQQAPRDGLAHQRAIQLRNLFAPDPSSGAMELTVTSVTGLKWSSPGLRGVRV